MNLAGQIFLKLTKLRSENGLIQLRDVLFPGCKENHFYSLPFGQVEASIY